MGLAVWGAHLFAQASAASGKRKQLLADPADVGSLSKFLRKTDSE